MLINKFLTRRGWRVVAHSLLAAAGIGIIYLLAEMIAEDCRQGIAVNWLVFSAPIILSLSLVALGSMLAKAELTDWK